MSKTLERQIADAERAETVPPDPEPDDDDTPDGDEPETGVDDDEEGHEAEQEEAQAAVSPEDREASMQAQQQALEREATRHYKALEKLMPGFEHDFAECPLCMTFGYLPNPPLKLDETREVCARCNGRGGTITGSLVPGHDVEQCSGCQGNGWQTKTTPPPATTPAYTAPGMPTGNGPAYEDPRVAELRAAGYIVTSLAPPPTPGA